MRGRGGWKGQHFDIRHRGERQRVRPGLGKPWGGRWKTVSTWYSSFKESGVGFKLCGPCIDASQLYWARRARELKVK